jgi:uncharacterized protein YbjT (DUF2867 family)
VLLLTGATGRVGSALLRRLVARNEPVRCLVRDPRRLGPERVRVQIALGDLGDPASFRHALRGVKTVVHLAATERDQPHATIEEIDGIATWRLLRAAEQAGARRFIFLSPLGASAHHRARVHRTKALAERAVTESALDTTILRCSLIYAPGDTRLRLIELLTMLPAVPVTGTMETARVQPIWADDVAACVEAVLASGPKVAEIAGPEALTARDTVMRSLRAAGRERRLVTLPTGALLRALHVYEALTGPIALATRDEADVLGATMVTDRGTADAEALGVRPLPIDQVLRTA